ncbi:MAG: transcriptional repressor LexA [Dehalococcoidia bacterium]|tara:strand:- start:1544 stop:2173 length:630 start_codon:yes stop_codon:yes gene_type:complete
MELTAKQDKILNFLKDFILEKDYPPSIRDIQTHCSISSTSVVDYNLKKLEEKGLIRRDKDISRGIEILGDNNIRSRTIRVPLLGKIAAGKPINIPTESSTEDYTNAIELSRDQIGAKTDLFALQIKGNSMIDALIQDGDIIILERTNQFDNGDMVAVWIKSDNSTTFKRIYKLDNKIKLEPMNKKMKSFYIDPSSFQVQGRFVTSIRHW